MICFDVVVNGKVIETIQPANQRLSDIQWFVVDRLNQLKVNVDDKNTKVVRYKKY